MADSGSTDTTGGARREKTMSALARRYGRRIRRYGHAAASDVEGAIKKGVDAVGTFVRKHPAATVGAGVGAAAGALGAAPGAVLGAVTGAIVDAKVK